MRRPGVAARARATTSLGIGRSKGRSAAPMSPGTRSSSHGPPGPHASWPRRSPSHHRRRVPGPSGVRVARHTSARPTLVVGSPRPCWSGPSVWRRSSVCRTSSERAATSTMATVLGGPPPAPDHPRRRPRPRSAERSCYRCGMTDADPILVSRPHTGIVQITMNRPARLNAMTTELVEGLHQALNEVKADASARVVILTGAGRGFCAGLDLRGYGEAPDAPATGSVQAGFAVQRHIASLIPHLRSLPQPVIAAVNGPAAGGGFALVLG